jgi:hypothetical protein
VLSFFIFIGKHFTQDITDNKAEVRKSLNWRGSSKVIKLEDRNLNIPSQFVRIFKVFEDFTFIAQLREEIEKVKPVIPRLV